MKPTTWIHPGDLAILLALFEGSTYGVLGFLVMNGFVSLGIPGIIGALAENLTMGLIVGIAGTVIALFIWHVSRRTLRTDSFTITHINVIPASIANALFLFILFTAEDILRMIQGIPVVGLALYGFFATLATLLVLLMIYNHQPFKLVVRTNGEKKVQHVPVMTVAIFAGIFEAVILPLMTIPFLIGIPTTYAYITAGLTAGLVGGLLGTTMFNFLGPLMKPTFRLT